MIRTFGELLLAVQGKPAKTIAVVSPEGSEVVKLIKAARAQRLADFVLVGAIEKVRALAAEFELALDGMELLDVPHPKDAAAAAVRLVVAGRAEALMKGNLPTATFLKAILDKETGLSDQRIISEVTLYEKEDGEGLQILTDCAINISPDLAEKVRIIDNAVRLARTLGYERPKVAVLSAVEVVNPALPDTLDAAVLSKMAERGQIRDCVIDGPLAFDNAVSREAAAYKNLHGEVAGQADILLAPNLQVANPLHKALVFWAHKEIATAVLGARAPIVMTSRSDSMETMLYTIALASYIS